MRHWMVHRSVVISFLAVLAWLGAGFAAMAQAPAAAGSATVLQIRGAARYSTDSRTWQSLTEGTVLPAGSLIQTAPKSTASLLLDSGSAELDGLFGSPNAEPAGNAVRIYADSVVSIDKLAGQETQLDLRRGRIQAAAKRAPTGTRFEVKLPKGMVGLRAPGSSQIDANGAVEVYSGSAVVATTAADGSVNTKVLRAGQQLDPAAGTVTAPPNTAATETQPSVKTTPASEPKANRQPPVGPATRPGPPLRPF